MICSWFKMTKSLKSRELSRIKAYFYRPVPQKSLPLLKFVIFLNQIHTEGVLIPKLLLLPDDSTRGHTQDL